MTILVTRPEPDASDLVDCLMAKGHEATAEPMLTIDFAGFAPISLEGVDALIATSRNALAALSRDPAMLAAKNLPLVVVGAATETMAREMGFRDIICGSGSAASLPQILADNLKPQGGALLHLAGADLATDLEPPLTALGFCYLSQRVYRAKPRTGLSAATIELFHQGKIDSVLLMSPRTANIYANLIIEAGLNEIAGKTTHFCFSENVARRLGPLGNPPVLTTVKPCLQEMLALIDDRVAKRR